MPSLSEYGAGGDATEAPLGSYGAASEEAARDARRFRGGRGGRTSSRRGRSRGRGRSSSSRIV